jgi:hypothetical protein
MAWQGATSGLAFFQKIHKGTWNLKIAEHLITITEHNRRNQALAGAARLATK